ncbi:SPOR domain-containing protein [Stenotrophomonas mori]|uniref:SPOR domain-containing protein n=1 Tax=Stenotrophomonas mori TaxID=2871096 RepID=A0ABT0SJ30_9GAMM|nr:SPOR domain-containing protein [Stenotrophomonas mori]MCL7715337.1 SPOR domain-containing protein [Stenotrophomonas mori]
MVIRFLIVVLVILNAGVALWWWMPRTPPATVPAAEDAGVATLELVSPETLPHRSIADPAPATDAAAVPEVQAPVPAIAAPAATAPPVQVSERCASLGPFESRQRAEAAAAALGAQAVRTRVREVASKAAPNYRVYIPPAADRDAAQAMAKRIVDAGFSDYFIVAQGEDAHAVALGQYRNREGAERRLAALTAAGFPARIARNPGEGDASWWLDVAHAGQTAAELQRRSGAAQRQSLDCARLR